MPTRTDLHPLSESPWIPQLCFVSSCQQAALRLWMTPHSSLDQPTVKLFEHRGSHVVQRGHRFLANKVSWCRTVWNVTELLSQEKESWKINVQVTCYKILYPRRSDMNLSFLIFLKSLFYLCLKGRTIHPAYSTEEVRKTTIIGTAWNVHFVLVFLWCEAALNYHLGIDAHRLFARGGQQVQRV